MVLLNFDKCVYWEPFQSTNADQSTSIGLEAQRVTDCQHENDSDNLSHVFSFSFSHFIHPLTAALSHALPPSLALCPSVHLLFRLSLAFVSLLLIPPLLHHSFSPCEVIEFHTTVS